MPAFTVRDGWPMAIDWSAPGDPPSLRPGEPLFATLLGAVRLSGVEATVFDHPIRVEQTFDADAFFVDGSMVLLGAKAAYRIVT
jgi:hypothetical protein